MKKIYGVQANGGEYSDRWENTLFMSYDEQLCIDTANALNKRYDEAYEWYCNQEKLSYDARDMYLKENFNLSIYNMFDNVSYVVIEIPLVSNTQELIELNL